MRSVEQLIAEWQEHKVLTSTAATKIRDYEATRESATGDVPEATRSSALSEVLGYLGAALAVSAIAFILGSQWDSLAYAVKIVLVAILTTVVVGAGLVLWRSPSAAAQRLVSVLMVAGVAGVTWLAWLIVRGDVGVDEYVRGDEDWSGLAVGVAMVASAIPLYLYRRRALPMATAIVSLLTLIGAMVAYPGSELRWELATLGWSVVGAVVFWGAVAKRLRPEAFGIVAGGSVALFGLLFAAFDEWRLGVLVAGVLVAAGLAAFAVFERGTLTSLIPGAIGMLVFIPQLINEIFEDSLLTWVAVLVTGLGLVVVSVLMARERKPTHT